MKRTRPASSTSLSKKIQPETLKADKDIQNIRTLEAQIHDSQTNLNNILSLLTYCQSTSHEKVIHAAIHALHRVFTPALESKQLVRQDTSADTKKSSAKKQKQQTLPAVANWLKDNYIRYLDVLLELLHHSEPGLQVPALNLLLDLVKREAAVFGRVEKGPPVFPNNLYTRIVTALAKNPNFSSHLKETLVEKYLVIYDDLRYYMYKNLPKAIEKQIVDSTHPKSTPRKGGSEVKRVKVDSMEVFIENVFTILDSFRTMPTEESEIDEFWTGHPAPELQKQKSEESSFSDSEPPSDDEAPTTTVSASSPPILHLSSHRKVFAEAWLAFLRLPFSELYYKRILLMMHKKIMPHMPRPTLLMDFLTDSYNNGGVISLLALNGLFTLISEHNLDYPDFFGKLYALLDRDLLHVKYRTRFFRMLDLFLTSSHIPAYMIAAFAKRLARLSLAAPPAACVVIMPMVYNLLKRHPTVMKLIHRNSDAQTVSPLDLPAGVENGNGDGEKTEPGRPGDDPFLFEEMDPKKCHALESSLWELKTLREHFHPNVSSLAKMFEEKFNKPSYNLEDFMDHTYNTMFEADTTREIKKTPAVTFTVPVGIADSGSVFNDVWSFE